MVHIFVLVIVFAFVIVFICMIVFVFMIVFVIVKLLQRVSRAGDIAKLPVDVSLNACNMEEHVHPAQSFQIFSKYLSTF